MKITKELNEALTVMQRYSSLESALVNLKVALQAVGKESLTSEMTTEINKMRDYVEAEIRNYNFRAAERYIEENL